VIFLISLSLTTATAAVARVTLPGLFSDNMVLQRESEVALWGRSDQLKLTIASSWNAQPVMVQVNTDGTWKVKLKTPKAGGPYTLTFDDGERLMIGNVLIGEVWICSGQSNMDMPVKGLSARDTVMNKKGILASAFNPNIRLFKLPHRASAQLEKDSPSRWQLSDSITANTFSAVGFQYAQRLQEKLNVPVGIIHSAWSGTRIEPWISPGELAPFSYSRPPADTTKISRTSPSALFNGMIGPLAGFTFKGVIWYQGESNLAQHRVYDKMMAAMVDGWKKAWKQEKMAFYYVQIAPFSYGRGTTVAAYLREAQERAMSLIPDSYMVPTIDIGSGKTIHPSDKTTVSQRLANAALVRTYGSKGLAYENVGFKSIKLKAGKAVVRVKNASQGLVFEGNSSGFEVSGDDEIFYPATVTIQKSKIELQSSKVARVVAARYCFGSEIHGTVKNQQGLPLLPFRTDKWAIKKEK
jgi:sialate O-acetylesterase